MSLILSPEIRGLLLFAHVLAVVVWIGGAFFFSFVLVPNLNRIPPAQAGILMRHVGRRFLLLVWFAMITVAAAGLIMAFAFGYFNFSILFGTGSGFLLLSKMSVLLVAIVIGLIITFVLLPVALTREPRAFTANRRIERLSKANVVLGVVAVLMGVLL